jgi:hypothetical protein
MALKCAWCNKENEQIKQIKVLTKKGFGPNLQETTYFVCLEHEQKFRKFYDRVRRYALLFIGLSAISLLGLIVSALLANNNYLFGYLLIASFAFIGLVFIIFPFATPETIEMVGVAKSIRLVRIIGTVIFAIGATVLVLVLCAD